MTISSSSPSCRAVGERDRWRLIDEDRHVVIVRSSICFAVSADHSMYKLCPNTVSRDEVATAVHLEFMQSDRYARRAHLRAFRRDSPSFLQSAMSPPSSLLCWEVRERRKVSTIRDVATQITTLM